MHVYFIVTVLDVLCLFFFAPNGIREAKKRSDANAREAVVYVALHLTLPRSVGS